MRSWTYRLIRIVVGLAGVTLVVTVVASALLRDRPESVSSPTALVVAAAAGTVVAGAENPEPDSFLAIFEQPFGC